MTLEDVKESYKIIINTEQVTLSKLKKTIFRIGTIRLLLVLACIALCYAMWYNTAVVIGVVGLSIIIYLVLMKYHDKLFSQKRYSELIIQNAENELQAVDYNFSAFDGAPEKADADHSYGMDLDLFGNKSFFQALNRTVTPLGKEELANSLLFPMEKKDEITDQQCAIKELSRKTNLLNHFRAIGMMTDTEGLDVNYFSQQFLQTKLRSKSFWRYFVYIAPIVLLPVLALSIFNIIPISVFGLCWTIFFVLSLLALGDAKQKLGLFEKKIETLKTYSRLFQIIESEKFESSKLTDIQIKVKDNQCASQAVNQLKRYSNNLDQSSNILGLLILNPFFFWNIIYSIKIEKWIMRNKENVASWFESLAQFDSLVSMANFAYNNPEYTYPEACDNFVLEGKNLGHPMLNRSVCVRNDIDISHNPYFLVITGANMAGKSTYLRTVGINLVLACAGMPVCADSFRFYPYRLVTNLRTSDSLADNESYFFAELKRLKMIIDRLQSGEHLFIILDEILKGTNSEDKQKGSIALMKQLVSLNGNGIIATHDLILGNLEEEFPEAIKNYRFEADIEGEHLSFTYKMREGVAQNMNASFLMKKMGITGL